MTIRNRWPEEPEIREEPSRYQKTVKWRLFCATCVLLIVVCIVLFMFLFHDVLPENNLLSFFLCAVFTGAVLFVVYRVSRWYGHRRRETAQNSSRNQRE